MESVFINGVLFPRSIAEDLRGQVVDLRSACELIGAIEDGRRWAGGGGTRLTHRAFFGQAMVWLDAAAGCVLPPPEPQPDREIVGPGISDWRTASPEDFLAAFDANVAHLLGK